MSKRITWQNVAAPDFSAAIAGTKIAGDLIGSGFTGVADTMKDYRATVQEQASNGAMLEAMKYKDSAAWDAAMKSGGISGMGITPEYATKDLIDFTKDRRTTLLGNESTVADTAYRGQATDSLNNATMWSDKNNTFDYNAAVKAQKLAEETKAAELASLESAREVARGSYDLKAAEKAIYDKKLSGPEQARQLAALGTLPNMYEADAGIAAETAVMPDVMVAKNTLTTRKNNLTLEGSSNELSRLYSDALGEFAGSSNPDEAVIGELRTASAGDEELFSESSAAFKGLSDRYSAKYKNLPKEVIAIAIRNNARKSKMWELGQFEVDETKIDELLDGMNDPDSRAFLESQRAKLENGNAALTNDSRKLTEAMTLFSKAKTKGNNADMAKAMEIIKGYAETAEVNGSQGEDALTPGSTEGNLESMRDAPTEQLPPAVRGAPVGPRIDAPGSLDAVVSNDRANMSSAFQNSIIGDAAGGAKTALEYMRDSFTTQGGVVDKANTYLSQGLAQNAETLGRGIGLVNRDAGVAAISNARDWQESLGSEVPAAVPVGNPSSAADTPMVPAIDPDNGMGAAVTWAAQNPDDALAIVAGEMDIPEGKVAEVTRAMQVLKSGVNPATSSVLSGAKKAEYEGIVTKFIEGAKQKAASQGSDLDPNIAALLERSEAWLKR